MTHLAIITKHDPSLINFRGPLIKDLLKKNHKVTALSPFNDQKTQITLSQWGVQCLPTPIDGTGLNPIKDLWNGIQLFLNLKKIKPDVSLCYFVKPVIWGSLAAFFCGVKLRVVMIEGLGFAFTKNPFTKEVFLKNLLKLILITLYKLSLKTAHKVIFLNQDDFDYFIYRKLIQPHQGLLLGPIGVSLSDWRRSSEKSQTFTPPLRFIFVGRCLKEKGLLDLMNAVEILKHYFINHQMTLTILGDPDTNPGSINLEILKNWEHNFSITHKGHVDNVRSELELADVFILPSYREGVPRSSQEAAAMGLPIITTQAPGCKDTVIDGYNGFTVPLASPESLSKKMLYFLNNPLEIIRMGNNSQQLAKDKFDSQIINKKLIHILEMEQ